MSNLSERPDGGWTPALVLKYWEPPGIIKYRNDKIEGDNPFSIISSFGLREVLNTLTYADLQKLVDMTKAKQAFIGENCVAYYGVLIEDAQYVMTSHTYAIIRER